MEPKVAASNALEAVLEARPGESILIVTDDVRKDVADAFAEGAIELGLWTRMVVLDTEEDAYRVSPPHHLVEMINAPNPPDIYINILRGHAKETPFRIAIIKLETRKGQSRLGHCPGITMDMLTEGALSLSRDENAAMQKSARSLLANLQDVETVHVTSPSGSDFTFSVRGRTWFSDTYLNWKDMKWMNLPTGEVLVGPVETSMNGTLVCDLAVGGVGPLETPVSIKVENGRVTSIESEDKRALKLIEETQATDEMAKFVGEFAFGLNPKARIVQEFLESEKVGNAIHVAFGNNMDYPGVVANNSANHQDFLVDRPTVNITYSDGRQRTVMENGKLLV
ncbi:MAG: aminopeptidase [Candidatus Thorarchaeota archaeon]|nr:aminopeptidase [Candidatus Thorarchaeota archaeon]